MSEQTQTIKKHKIAPKHAGRTVDHAQVITMLEQGYRKSRISKACNCSWNQVHRIAQKYGYC